MSYEPIPTDIWNEMNGNTTKVSKSAVMSDSVSLNLKQFKVSEINCDGWIVVPEVERALKELFEKHNALVDYLSTAI